MCYAPVLCMLAHLSQQHPGLRLETVSVQQQEEILSSDKFRQLIEDIWYRGAWYP